MKHKIIYQIILTIIIFLLLYNIMFPEKYKIYCEDTCQMPGEIKMLLKWDWWSATKMVIITEILSSYLIALLILSGIEKVRKEQ